MVVLEHLSGPQFLVVATFKEQGGKTKAKVTFPQIFRSAAECEKKKLLFVPANQQDLDRLEAEFAKMS